MGKDKRGTETFQYNNKVFAIPSKGKAVKILKAEWWDAKTEYKDKGSHKVPPDTIQCGRYCNNKWLYIYLDGGGIKIEEAEVFDFDLTEKQILPKSQVFTGKSVKTQIADACGFTHGDAKNGFTTLTPVVWI